MNAPKVYYHCFAVTGRWQTWIDEQLGMLCDHGLTDVRMGLSVDSGEEREVLNYIWQRFPFVKIISIATSNLLYEGQTLRELHSASQFEDGAFLYLHTKGITQKYHSFADDWRRLMQHFCIARWHDCVEKLREYDCVGVNWTTVPAPHFSGNFWWANAEYIRKLPVPIHTKDRYDYEMWIGSLQPSAFSFHNSDVNHYRRPYPPEKYIRS